MMKTKPYPTETQGSDVRLPVMEQRIDTIDWQSTAANIDANGYAVLDSVLTDNECQTLIASYTNEERFRKRIVMARHNFGRGEYKYFDYPLPTVVAELRDALYPHLANVANHWNERLGVEVRYPKKHADYLERCHQDGQTRPTPLLLKYEEGDYNRLHQDLYGEHVFPLQAVFLLSASGQDFTGGEFIMTEQRPRQQSRAEVVALERGDCVIFPVYQRPVQGTRGSYRVNMRHGVSRLRSGDRYALGIIFHDAK